MRRIAAWDRFRAGRFAVGLLSATHRNNLSLRRLAFLPVPRPYLLLREVAFPRARQALMARAHANRTRSAGHARQALPCLSLHPPAWRGSSPAWRSTPRGNRPTASRPMCKAASEASPPAAGRGRRVKPPPSPATCREIRWGPSARRGSAGRETGQAPAGAAASGHARVALVIVEALATVVNAAASGSAFSGLRGGLAPPACRAVGR